MDKMDSDSFLKKHNLSIGSKIELISKKEKFSGIIIPSLSKESIQLKFSNGYNAGFKVNEITSIKEFGKIKPEKKELNLIQKKGLPKILVLHTGGTIASKVDYSLGGVTASFKSEDLIALVPELTELAEIETKQVSNLMSEDMTFNYYKKISKELFNASEKFKGIIVAHGTDTLAYSSAAMSFALQNIKIPVLFVGSQRSPDRPSTDAAENLLNAVYFISKTDFAGIGICMHESISDGNAVILSGTKTRKMHSSRRDAFKAINDIPIARVNYHKNLIEYLKNKYSKKSNKKTELKNKFEEKIALMKMHPNLLSEEIDFYQKQKYKGLVLEGTGMGHAPTNSKENLKNFEALKKLIKSGTIIVMTTQCLYGRVYSEVYTNLRRLNEIGVIFAEDMLPETAFIKLAWCLGNNPKKAKELFLQNIAGEFNERTPFEFKME
jgi:glutamyl-tRNA(Gln) amidotransferase subunit D